MTITKFTHGAYLVFIAIPVLAVLMIGVNRYYRDVEHEIRMDDHVHFGAAGDIALILVNRLQKPVAKAIDYALAAKHDKTLAIHVAVTKEEADATPEGVGGAPDADPPRRHPVAVSHLRGARRRLHQAVPRDRTARRS